MTSLVALTPVAHGNGAEQVSVLQPNPSDDLVIKHIGECENCGLSNIDVSWWNEIKDYACDACRHGER